MKKWFMDILEALNHLYKVELCHLDLKIYNILICSCDSAILFDFPGLNVAGFNLDRFVSLDKYRPLELVLGRPIFENGDKEVEGIAYDMLAFSVLALNCLTYFCPGRHMSSVIKQNRNWKNKVKPVIRIP